MLFLPYPAFAPDCMPSALPSAQGIATVAHSLKKSEYYRQRAAEAREKAAGMQDVAAKEAMEQVATSYELLAKMAAKHEVADSN
ncbi:hypothetical protein SAMN02990966_07975 [Rhodospirillales bacterium URHD0017]|nr:hypothetical protein SAMN02990966_07975 [Rhodospirillales bacterium URHD0017]